MPSIDHISISTKKKLNYLKAALTDEFDKEPTWDQTLNWLMKTDEIPYKLIQKRVRKELREEQ